MAKQKTDSYATLAQLVPLHEIIWFRDQNKARMSQDYGDKKELDFLQNQLATYGWRQTGDGTIDVIPLSKELQERAVTERTKKWNDLKTLASVDPERGIDLKVFEESYTEDGKLKPIKFLGVSGNRRGEVVFNANIARRKNVEDKKPAPLPLIDVVPAKICHFDSVLDFLEAQSDENQFKTEGFRPPTALDNLLLAKEAVSVGANQQRLRKMFKDGVGQKLWGVVQLNARFPELNIIKRMLMDPTDPEFIPLGPVSHKDMAGYVLRSDPERLAEENAKTRAELERKGVHPDEIAKKMTAPLGPSEVLNYFVNPKAKGNEPKIMSKEGIKGIMDVNDILVIRATAKAIYNNNGDVIDKYGPFKLAYNALDALMADNDLAPVDYILQQIVASKDRATLLKELTQTVEALK